VAKSPLHQKLQAIASDFTCGDWGSPTVLSPQRYMEKVERDCALQPGPITDARQDSAAGRWALIFQGRMTPSARTGTGGASLEATATFTPDEVRRLDGHEIRKVLIGVIAETELHEVLEWAQRRSSPGDPIVNPHRLSDDLVNVVNRVADALIEHAAIGAIDRIAP
jgi:hypothetical protein